MKKFTLNALLAWESLLPVHYDVGSSVEIDKRFGLIWLLSFIFLSLQSFAQEKVASKDSTNNKVSAWAVKLTPSSLFTLETPTVQVGVEFVPWVKRNISLEVDYGFQFLSINTWDNRNNKIYDKSRIELRYYLKPFKHPKKTNYYLGLEVFHINYNYSKSFSEYVALDNKAYTYDLARISKQIDGWDIKLGSLTLFSSRKKNNNSLLIEGFFGLGCRYVSVYYNEVINKQNVKNDFTLSSWFNNNEQRVVRGHISAGFKLTYLL